MKKSLKFLLVLSLLCSFAGCGSQKDDSSVSESSNVEISEKSKKSDVSDDDGIAEIIDETEEETTEYKQEYARLARLTIPLSEKFDQEFDTYAFHTYNVTSSKNDTMYCSFMCSEMYGDFDDVRPVYDYTNAPEIFEDTEEYMVHDFFDYPIERTVESEETVECLGYPFIKQKGTFKVKFYSDESIHYIYFVGYYGCMYISTFDDKSVPVMWISFSETEDEQTKKEMEEIVDECAAKVIIEEK